MSIKRHQSPHSDWHKNWGSSIAVKVTAPVFWVLITIGLISATVVQNRFANQLPDTMAADADRVAFAVGRYLLELEGGQPLELQRVIEDAMAGMHFVAGDIKVGLRDVHVGQPVAQKGKLETVVRRIPYANKLQSGDALIAELKLYHQPYPRIIKDERKDMLVKYGSILFAFGLLLAGLIHLIVTKPITKLLSATKSVSDGDMSSRLGNDREDEFGQLTEFFNRMLDKLQNKQDELSLAVKVAESASSAKSAFLANMSHEIRTPLTALLGFSTLLKDDSISREESRQHIESIIRAGNHLQQIINDILDMSKIEAGQLVIEKNDVSLVEIISDVDFLMRPYAEEKGLRFRVKYDFPLPGYFVTDATRLKQVLLNLCSNAIKFTNDGNIEIKVSFVQPRGLLQFEVIDTGVGMSKAELERLFTPFSQADSSNTRRYGGTGLGLCICRELVTSLGGDINCQSRKGIGSRFQFTIDPGEVPEEHWINEFGDEQKPQPRLEMPLQPGSLLGKVLLAEDTPDNQKLISMYIQRAGATAIVVDNGKKALNKALTEEFDLILMDTQMPVMGGVEATVKLRGSGYHRPIVALTANALKEDREQSTLAGVDDYLTKPVDINRFNDVLKRYLKPVSISAQQPVPGDKDNSVATLDEDPEFQALLKQFEQELPMKLEDIQSALKAENWQELRSQVHKLKGLGTSFGYPEISEIAAKIQNSIVNGQFDAIGELTSKLYNSYYNSPRQSKLSSGF
ncbi:MAG: ATP-binding protein [Gammaproteobacteria bacterium]|jgi:signal transduction histidine kinase/CheY-like chemotaxis protein/HPt (histidine-containing phosphotransfer) domain-containing protein